MDLNHWRRTPDQRAAAWSYMRYELAADVALVQEAASAPSGWQVVGTLDPGEGRRWGAGVVSPRHPLQAITQVKPLSSPRVQPLKSSVRGTAATASVSIRGVSLTLTSLYGLMERGQAYATMNRHLGDLVPLLDSPDHYKQVLVGGD